MAVGGIKFRRRAFALLIGLAASLAHAAESGDVALIEELARQEAIYQSRGAEVPAGYTIDRSLLSYTKALPEEFDRALGVLRPDDRWLDIGAGRGQAILDYYTPKFDMLHFEGREERGGKAQAVAISIEDRRTEDWQAKAATLPPDKIVYLFGRRLREYKPDELGRFKLITDVVGGFSYTTTLSLFVERVLSLLEVNGSFFTVLSDVSREAGGSSPHYAGSPFLTVLTRADGSDLKVCAWLKSISCVQVTCEAKEKWVPPIEAFHVQKTCDQVVVPALTPVHFEAGTPPERGFKLAQ
ncbi:MAG: hypothetical protein JWN94_180 [Betaproteobacteria bacterium]|nr:hypothetical protein [Betaproteobacteria bacterium]